MTQTEKSFNDMTTGELMACLITFNDEQHCQKIRDELKERVRIQEQTRVNGRKTEIENVNI